MYKIIGGDQKEYGPVSLEQIVAWLRDNRANAQTLVQREGGPWVPLGTLAEFAPFLSAQTGPTPTPTPDTGPQSTPYTPYAGSGPTSFSSGGGTPGRAQELVSGPATAMLVTGILCAVLSVIALVMNLTGSAFTPPPGEMPAEMKPFFDMMQQMQGPVAIVSSLISVAISGLIIFAAQKLRALQSFSLVVTAAILAIVPCTSPCCCIGIPVGIWVLVVLFKPEVKSAFQ